MLRPSMSRGRPALGCAARRIRVIETIERIRKVVRGHIARQAECLEHDLRPALAEHGIRIVGIDTLK